MKDEEKDIELTKKQLGETSGGGGKPKPGFGKRTVTCPSCGAENEIPVLVSVGCKPTCSNCGAELEP